MSSILMKGIVRGGRVELDAAIDLPDGSEVLITGPMAAEYVAYPPIEDRLMSPAEIAERLAAMDKVEPLELTDDERAAAAAWEKQINDYTIAKMNKDIKDVFE